MDKFWNILEDRLELCHTALQCRIKKLKGTPASVAPILWQHGALARLKPDETIDKLMYGGYATISLGYAGIAEMTMRMTGHFHTEDPESKKFALAVMQKLNDKCAEWKKAENIDYSLYGTPLESTTYKFAKALQRDFGEIENVSDHIFITNSYHCPVYVNINAFDKLEFEAEFQKLSPGGAISYVEVPNLQNNVEAIISLLKFMYKHIMYAEINSKTDYCMNCGYDGEIEVIGEEGNQHWECPNCHCTDEKKMYVVRRTCGYLGSNYWNAGRTAEISERVLHLSVSGNDKDRFRNKAVV